MADPFEIFNTQNDSDFANFLGRMSGPDLTGLRKEAQIGLPQSQYITYLELSKNDERKFAIGLLSGFTIETLKQKLAQINELKPSYFDKATNGDQFQKIIYPLLMKQLDAHYSFIEAKIVCILEGGCTESKGIRARLRSAPTTPAPATPRPAIQFAEIQYPAPKPPATAVSPVGMTKETFVPPQQGVIPPKEEAKGGTESAPKSDNKALIYVGVAIAGILLFNTLKK